MALWSVEERDADSCWTLERAPFGWATLLQMIQELMQQREKTHSKTGSPRMSGQGWSLLFYDTLFWTEQARVSKEQSPSLPRTCSQ